MNSKKMLGPCPDQIYPLQNYQNLVFLKNLIKAPNIHVGDFTYYDDKHQRAEDFEENNVLYNYDFAKVKLIIGKFCAIAAQTKFIMTGDHKLDAISTYPFPIFQQGWTLSMILLNCQLKEILLLAMMFGLVTTH